MLEQGNSAVFTQGVRHNMMIMSRCLYVVFFPYKNNLDYYGDTTSETDPC